MSDEYDYVFKIWTVGDPESGLLARVVDDPEANANSLKDSAGIDSKIKTVELHGKKLKLQIFDVSKQEQFKFLQGKFKPYAIIIVYDVTTIASFNKAKKWLEENANGSACKLLVGNNYDLDDNDENKIVKTKTVEELASKFKIPFIETSAERPDKLERALRKMTKYIKSSKIYKTGAIQMEG